FQASSQPSPSSRLGGRQCQANPAAVPAMGIFISDIEVIEQLGCPDIQPFGQGVGLEFQPQGCDQLGGTSLPGGGLCREQSRHLFQKRVRWLLPEFFLCVVKDRKSTRLNSSHVSISYDVFCL